MHTTLRACFLFGQLSTDSTKYTAIRNDKFVEIISNILQQQQRHIRYKIQKQVRICLFFFIKFKRRVSSAVPYFHTNFATDMLHILLASPPLATWNYRADVGPPYPVSPKHRFTNKW
jgi:hypothetical protein